jgi:hypothetical protein
MSSGTEQVEVGDHDIIRPIREHLTSAARRSGRCSYPYSRGCRCPLREILRISARITAVLAALTLGRSLSVTEEMTGVYGKRLFLLPAVWYCGVVREKANPSRGGDAKPRASHHKRQPGYRKETYVVPISAPGRSSRLCTTGISVGAVGEKYSRLVVHTGHEVFFVPPRCI